MSKLDDCTIISPGGHTTTTETLICRGLGFCCPYAFFLVNRSIATNLIATRLGVSPRTVRVWRTKFREKELSCTNQSNCLKYKLKEIARARKTHSA